MINISPTGTNYIGSRQGCKERFVSKFYLILVYVTRNHVRLREQARSVCSKLSVMVDAKMNEIDHKLSSSAEEDKAAVLAEDENDHDTTGAHAIPPNKLWEAIQGLQKKVDLLAGTSTRITDASLKRKIPQMSKAESKSDSNSQPGPSKKKARKALSDSD